MRTTKYFLILIHPSSYSLWQHHIDISMVSDIICLQRNKTRSYQHIPTTQRMRETYTILCWDVQFSFIHTGAIICLSLYFVSCLQLPVQLLVVELVHKDLYCQVAGNTYVCEIIWSASKHVIVTYDIQYLTPYIKPNITTLEQKMTTLLLWNPFAC